MSVGRVSVPHTDDIVWTICDAAADHLHTALSMLSLRFGCTNETLTHNNKKKRKRIKEKEKKKKKTRRKETSQVIRVILQ